MTLEDRFRKFASDQGQPAAGRRGAYEKNLQALKQVDAVVSGVLQAFCQAMGWGLKRNDCCDPEKGAVRCNYILEHPDYWREGFVAVDVDVTWASQSDPVDAVTIYQGEIGSVNDHVRIFASRLAIPFSAMNEDKLAAALEQQSANIIRRINYQQKPQ